MLLILLGACAACFVTTRPMAAALVKRHGTMPPPMIGAISILFGLFIGFSSAEITQRAGSLRLSTQREVSAARSILTFTTGLGPRANAVRQAMVEYLQVVTTTERDWLRARAATEPPGNGPVYSLNLITTGFVQQPGVSDVLKSALLNRVDELTNARTDRLTLTRGTGNVPQWLGLAALAIVTQLVGAIAVAGQRGGVVVFVAGFTATAMVGLVYLASADGLIGANRLQEQSAPFAALLTRTPQGAATEGETIARMRATGRLVIGARTDTFPFAYLDPRGEIVGYSIDLCRGIAERVRAAAGLGPVKVDVLALPPANRVAMIVNGTADMECDLTTDTNVREGQVAFLDSIFFGRAQVLARAASGVATVAGLRGKRLVAVAGSINMQAAADLNALQHLDMTIVPAPDTPAAFAMLGADQGDALMSSDVLIRALVVASAHPADYQLLQQDAEPRAYSIMVRRENEAFQRAANDALRGLMRNGEFEAIYKRWFLSPPPGGGVNLAMTMGAELRRKLDDVAR